jgi:serine/threonine protein kinase
MLHISDRGIVHRDLAIRNCLVARGNVLKISDMGLAREVDEQSEVYMATGGDPVPYRWTAVEAIEKLTYSEKSDVWSFAITAWEIFAMGSMPYVPQLHTMPFLQYLSLQICPHLHPNYPNCSVLFAVPNTHRCTFLSQTANLVHIVFVLSTPRR